MVGGRGDGRRWWWWASVVVMVVAMQPTPTAANFELEALQDVWDALGHCVDAIDSLTDLIEAVGIPTTTARPTPKPSTPTPSTPKPSTPTPSTPKPSTAAPSTSPPSTSDPATSSPSNAEQADPLRSNFDHEQQIFWFRRKTLSQGEIRSIASKTRVHPRLLLNRIVSSTFGQLRRREEQRRQNLVLEDRDARTTDGTTTTEVTTKGPEVEEWWDRVDATLVDIGSLTQEVQDGAVDADHADRMDDAATTLEDLVEEAYQNQSLVTPPSDETLALIEDTLDIVDSTIKFVEENLDAVQAALTETIVLIVVAAVILVVVVVALVVVLTRPWDGRCTRPKTQKKLSPSEDVALHPTTSVKGNSYIIHKTEL